MNLNANGYTIAAWIGVALVTLGVVATAILGRWWGVLVLAGFLALSLWLVKGDNRLPSLFDLLLVVAAVLNAAGWVFNLFKRIVPYDDITHGFTIFAVTLSFGYLIYHAVRVHFRSHGWLFVLMIASLGIAVGALWEVVEWVALGPLNDTVADLIVDGIGAVAAGLAARWTLRQEAPRSGR